MVLMQVDFRRSQQKLNCGLCMGQCLEGFLNFVSRTIRTKIELCLTIAFFSLVVKRLTLVAGPAFLSRAPHGQQLSGR